MVAEAKFKWPLKLMYLLSVLFICSLTSCKTSKPQKFKSGLTIQMNEYLDRRNEIKILDQSLNFSNKLVLSTIEESLDSILGVIKSERLAHYKETHFFPPSRMFFQSKEHIENDLLFAIIKDMPKGGILHLHTMAMGSAEWVLQKAIKTPEMCIYWKEENAGPLIKGQFKAFKKGEIEDGYIPVYQLINDDAQNKEEIKSLLTFDSYVDQDSFDIWGNFEQIFQRMTGFMRYEPIFSEYLIHGFELLVNDNIQHAELRMPFAPTLYNLDNEQLSIDSFVKGLEKAVLYTKKSSPQFTAKIIHANLRFKDNKLIWEDMKHAVNMRQRYPNWLVGYDLVAEEDNGHSTLFHLPSFLRLDSLTKANNCILPLYLHDGESNWIDNDNLYDAVLLNCKRIGHGFNLFRYPNLIEEVKKNNICIEINPLSNQILGYIRDLRMHPGQSYLKQGVTCIISSDDPQIFKYQGLSYDLWSILLAWDLNLRDLKALSLNSLKYSALDPAEKEQAISRWRTDWDIFVNQSLKKLKS